jgi:Ca2+-binding RTX toxin-like protein
MRHNAGGLAVDANDYILYDTATGKLYYDADGIGAIAKIQFAILTGAPTLVSADITVIG